MRVFTALLIFLLFFGPALLLADETLYRYEQSGLELTLSKYGVEEQEAVSGLDLLIHSSQEGQFAYFLLENPMRFVIDLPGVALEKNIARTITTPGILRGVRLGRHLGMARIVLDLRGDSVPTQIVSRHKQGLRVKIGEISAQGLTYQISTPKLIQIERKLLADLRTGRLREKVQAPGVLRDNDLSYVNARSGEEDTSKESAPLPLDVLRANTKLKFGVDRDSLQLVAGSAEVTVSNLSQERLELSAHIFEIRSAGTEREQQAPTSSLSVEPVEIVLLPGGSKKVILRLLESERLSEEKVYSLSLIPQADNFDSRTLEEGGTESQNAEYRMAAGITLMAFVAPEHEREQVQFARSDSLLSIENRGNVSVYLDQGKICANSQCFAVPGFRVYPGNKVGVEVPAEFQVSFLKRFGTRTEPISLDAAR